MNVWCETIITYSENIHDQLYIFQSEINSLFYLVHGSFYEESGLWLFSCSVFGIFYFSFKVFFLFYVLVFFNQIRAPFLYIFAVRSSCSVSVISRRSNSSRVDTRIHYSDSELTSFCSYLVLRA